MRNFKTVRACMYNFPFICCMLLLLYGPAAPRLGCHRRRWDGHHPSRQSCATPCTVRSTMCGYPRNLLIIEPSASNALYTRDRLCIIFQAPHHTQLDSRRPWRRLGASRLEERCIENHWGRRCWHCVENVWSVLSVVRALPALFPCAKKIAVGPARDGVPKTRLLG